MAKSIDTTKKSTTPEVAPSEDAILRELKQREVRKQYQTSDKAKDNRKKYQQKRYAQQTATRKAIDDLKAADPAKYEELMAQAKAAAIAGKK
jgi:hypothetical protein